MGSRGLYPYKTSNETPAPGVTTITGMLEKPALIHWAWKKGKAGEDYRKIRDDAGNIGTLIHKRIECFLKNTSFEEDVDSDLWERSQEGYQSFLDFYNKNDVQCIFSEHQYTSDILCVGGTIDWYGEVNGRYSIIDFKTSTGVYESHVIQLSAYKYLLEEEGYTVDDVYILHIPKKGGKVKLCPEHLSYEFTIFLSLLNAFNSYTQIKTDWRLYGRNKKNS